MTLQLKFSPELKAMLHVRAPTRIKILLIKERHLKRLIELSLKTAGEKPELEELSYEQKKWVNFRLSHSDTWSKVKENKIGDWIYWRSE